MSEANKERPDAGRLNMVVDPRYSLTGQPENIPPIDGLIDVERKQIDLNKFEKPINPQYSLEGQPDHEVDVYGRPLPEEQPTPGEPWRVGVEPSTQPSIQEAERRAKLAREKAENRAVQELRINGVNTIEELKRYREGA